MTRSLFRLLLICLLPLGLNGCSKPASDSQVAEVTETTESVATAETAESGAMGDGSSSSVSATGVTTEQAKAFGSLLESAMATGNSDSAADLILSEKILDRVVFGLELTGKPAESFRKGMMSNDPIMNTLQQLAAAVQRGGSYRLVRTVVRDGEMHAIFRLLDERQSLNYHDFRLVLVDGKARADRILVAATGESFAETLINTLGPTIKSQQSSSDRDSGEAKQKLKDLVQQSKMMQAARDGDAAKTRQIYDSLPAELKDLKSVQLARVLGSRNEPDEVYMSSMTDYANRFPGDPSVALMSFDRAVMNKDVDAVKTCMATLDKWTGGDDYLKLLSASVVSQWGAFDYAKQLYTRADPEKIGTAEAHDYKLSSALRCKDYSIVLAQMRALRDQFSWQAPDLTKEAAFADFVKSPEYKQWMSE